MQKLSIRGYAHNKWVKYVPLRCTGLATLRFASRLPKRYMLKTFTFYILFLTTNAFATTMPRCPEYIPPPGLNLKVETEDNSNYYFEAPISVEGHKINWLVLRIYGQSGAATVPLKYSISKKKLIGDFYAVGKYKVDLTASYGERACSPYLKHHVRM